MRPPVDARTPHRPLLFILAGFALPVLLTACMHGAPTKAGTEARQVSTAAAPAPAVVEEAYVSAAWAEDQLDSLAVWPAPQADAVWLVATAKSSHRLVRFDADTGERQGEAGGLGAEPGRFRRPNGIAIHGDMVFAAERDNRRVQILRLPDFIPLGSFGEDVLRAPYGLWLRPLGADSRGAETFDVYVTDDKMRGERYDIAPPLAERGRRAWRFRLRLPADGSAPRVQSRAHFGDTSEEGALFAVDDDRAVAAALALPADGLAAP